ncbi:MAG: phosphoserine phosphatase SerB [Micavibrio sp.]
MNHILVLIGSAAPLSIAHLERAEKFIGENALGLNGQPRWIDAHKAADIPMSNALTMDQMRALRRIFAAEEIDCLCVPEEGRRKKLLLADMDATIVTGETLDDLAAKAGLKDKIAAITARAMRGELDFEAALKERVTLLKGLPLAALAQTLKETELSDGAQKLVQTMRESGALCVLVSGGFTYFTEAVAQQCGFHHSHGNILHDDGEKLAGSVGQPILGADAKRAFLKSYAQQNGLDPADTLAIGDGANDLPMLAAAGLGIGYRPKPLLEENLLNILKYADLTGVLYAQGLRPHTGP